jgi:polysaccharide biosynthesis protein PslG
MSMRTLILPCVVAVTCVGTGFSADLPDLTVPHSLGIQIKTSAIEDVEKISKTGVGFMRRGFYWEAIESEKGVYDFSGYDAMMDKADQLGVRIIGCLFANKKAFYEPQAPAAGRAIQTEAGRQGYAAWAAACAAHFKGRNIYWEIWNEPNVQTFWRKGKHNSDEFADEYSRLVLATMPAMLKADPDCFVMAGSVSNYWAPVYEWTEACFKRGVLQSGIRAWSVHPYGVSTPEEHATGGGGGHERMRTLMRAYNKDVELPLINSERGFSVVKTKEGWSGGSQDRALEFQAWHFVRQYMIDLMTGTRVTIWYEWGDEGFGFLQKDGTPRPVYNACTTLVARLSGFTCQKRLDAGSPLDYLLVFTHPDGRHMLVAWTAPEKGKAPDQIVEHTLALPDSAKGATMTIDLFGTESPLLREGGNAVLQLHGSPQYVPY